MAAKDTKHALRHAKLVLLRLCDEEGRLTSGDRNPERSEISPIRHAFFTGLLQSRINGSVRGQKRPTAPNRVREISEQRPG